MAPRDRLKNVYRYTSSGFIRVLQANKIITKNKKIIRPTYPNFKKHVTGNTHIFLFGLSMVVASVMQMLSLNFESSYSPGYGNHFDLFVWRSFERYHLF